MMRAKQKRRRTEDHKDFFNDEDVSVSKAKYEAVLSLAMSKGIRTFTFFGNYIPNPNISSSSTLMTPYFVSFSNETDVRRVIEFANLHAFSNFGLVNCDLNWRGLDVLGGYIDPNMSTLTHLNISKNNLGPNGLEGLSKFLATNRVLKCLNLSRNQLVGLKVVHGKSEGEMSLVGIEALASALKSNSTLISLDLSQNYLGGTPTAAAASTFYGVVKQIADALSVNTTLQKLNISANNFSISDAEFLRRVIDDPLYNGNLSTLYGLEDGAKEAILSAKGILSADMVNLGFELEKQPVLTTLDLSNNTFLGSNGIKCLYDCLSDINTKHPLSKLILKSVCSRRFEEQFNKSVADIVKLATKGYICIEHLNLAENSGIFGEIGYGDSSTVWFDLTHAINESPTLKFLSLADCGINSDTSQCINFTNVPEVLDISFNRDLATYGIFTLGNLFTSRTLKHLRICGIDMRQLGMSQLVEFFDVSSSITNIEMTNNSMCGVRSLNFDPLHVVEFSEKLKASNITSLNFSHCDIGARSIRSLVSLAKHRFQIIHLEAYNCHVSEDGGIGIGAALPEITGLQVLKLGCCKLGSNGCKAVFDGLRFNRSVRYLDISSNMMTGNFDNDVFEYEVQALEAFRDCLMVNKTLDYIDISNNGLFGLRLQSPAGQVYGKFQQTACYTIAHAIRRNYEIGGNLCVLNLLKNKLPPVDFFSKEITNALDSAKQLIKDKYQECGFFPLEPKGQSDIDLSSLSWLLFERASRPSIDISYNEGSILDLFGILSSARINKNIKSLCGIEQTQSFANLSDQKLEDIEMLLLCFDIKKSVSLKFLDIRSNAFGQFGSFILGEALRENVWLKSLTYRHSIMTAPLCQANPDRIHAAKVFSFNFRMAIHLFLKKYDLNEMPPVRLIFEYLFGFDFVELKRLQISRHNPF